MEKQNIHERIWQRQGIRAEIRAASALAIKQWKVELSYPLSVLWFIVMPILWLIPYLLVGTSVTGGMESGSLQELVGTSDWLSYVAIGTAYTGLAISLLWGTGFALRREQNVGTLETLMTTPIKRETIVWGSTLHNLQHGGLGVVLQLGVSVLLFGVNLSIWGVLPALAVVGLSILAMQGLVLTVVCIVLVAKQAWMVVEFLSSILLLVAPMSYPLAVLPPLLQYVALASPLTWSVEGFRGFLMEGLAFSAAINAVGALVVLDVVFIVIGLLLFRVTEKNIRSRGALSEF
ncbi:MAG: ABC transporter permease [Candidatus Thorarchaeota archaeon]|nr:ABC transporter permease [Candidatus Thorarchaeota archaeon]